MGRWRWRVAYWKYKLKLMHGWLFPKPWRVVNPVGTQYHVTDNGDKLPIVELCSNDPYTGRETGLMVSIQNPEILNWTKVSRSKEDGFGWVWVRQESPIRILDLDTFEPKELHGKLHIGMSRIQGMGIGPWVLSPENFRKPNQGRIRGRQMVLQGGDRTI